MTPSTLDLIDRIGRIQVRPFLAPIVDAASVVVSTIQDGIQFNYKIVREPGWWVLYCDQSAVQRVDPPSSMFEIVQYLDILPRFLVIAVHRLRADTWMVVPWNTSDAAQRGWPDGEPKPMYLVRDAIRPFDIIQSRRLGRTILYNHLDEGLGTTMASEAMRERFNSGNQEIQAMGVSPEMRKVHQILTEYASAVHRREQQPNPTNHQALVEGRLRWHLAFVGAQLLGWNEAGEGYEVRWHYNAKEYTTVLRRDFQVSSAGICLAGTDQRHNLSTLVGVMEEAQRMEMED